MLTSIAKPGTGIFLLRERAKIVKAPQKRKEHPLGKRLKDYKGKAPVAVSSQGIIPPSTAGTIAQTVKDKHVKTSQDLKMGGEEEE